MRGKIVILVICLLALAASGFSWWWNYQRAVKARDFWGSSASTIRFAQQVEALEFSTLADKPLSDTIRFQDQVLGVRRRVDISQGKGLLNARTSLMVDEGFKWQATPVQSLPATSWSYGVQFRDGTHTVTLLFPPSGDNMAIVESEQMATLSGKTAAGWRTYLKNLFNVPGG